MTVHNRGPEAARLHLLPTLWFRNTWSWGDEGAKPVLPRERRGDRGLASRARRLHALLRRRARSCSSPRTRRNAQRLWGQPNPTPYVKDAFHRYVISGERDAVNPGEDRDEGRGALRPRGAGGRHPRWSQLRLTARPRGRRRSARRSTETFRQRLADADEFYERITPRSLSEDERRVHRQALAGMLWTKQYYYFDLDRWLKEHQAHPLLGGAAAACGTPSGSTC